VTDQSVTDDISLNNRKWTLEVEGKTGFAASVVLPLAVILGGSLMGFALAAFMLRSLLRRIEVVEKLYEAEVERTKDELLALASHQLRTPASGVKQYIGILTSGIMGDLTPAQQQIAEKAYTVNERQIEIINQLLYVSKIEAGKVTIRPQKSDLTAVVRRIIDQLSPNAERKNIKVSFRTRREVMIYGDDQYYPMIIDNLISNAIKYSFPNTTVTVRLTANDSQVILNVIDQGVGIAEEDKAELFKKFNRIENPLSRSEGGSGLGLFLAYQLARAHGGEIDVASKPGKGSTFVLTLPAIG
jgi:signal transduction histidine kinase